MRTCLLLLTVMCLVSYASGETVIMKDGAELEGKIIKQDENTITLEIRTGSIRATQKIDRRDIQEVKAEGLFSNELKDKLRKVDEKSPKALREAIAMCRQEGDALNAVRLDNKLKDLLVEMWLKANEGNICPACKGSKTSICVGCNGTKTTPDVCPACQGQCQITLDCSRCSLDLPGWRTTTKTTGYDTYTYDPRTGQSVPTGKQTEYTTQSVSRVYTGMVNCPECGGRGHTTKKTRTIMPDGSTYWNEEFISCATCKGNGKIVCPECKGRAGQTVTCAKCRGEGTIQKKCITCNGAGSMPCNACNGTGLKDPTKEVKIEE